MTAAPALVFDAARLCLSAANPTPRGIDRVDFAYATHFAADWPGEAFALLPTPWGMRLFGRARWLRGLAFLQANWSETADADADPVLASVIAWLAGADLPPPIAPPPRSGFGQIIRGLRATGLSYGLPVSRAPAGALYINAGQQGFSSGLTTHWLARRPDIACAFMLHDVIQIDHPALVTRAGAFWARRMLATVRARADALVTSTEAARRAIVAALGTPPTHQLVLPLPVAPAFLVRDARKALLDRHCYFVCVGSLEPRKNHAVLVAVWRELIARHGTAAPKLLVVGPTAHGGAPIRAMLDDPALRLHVRVMSGLSSPALRRLLAHARAALMPSRAEGFGLPAVEALAAGTRLVHSDIPALVEAAGGFGEVLGPDDVVGWLETIERLSQTPGALAPEYQPMVSATYFAQLDDFLRGLVA